MVLSRPPPSTFLEKGSSLTPKTAAHYREGFLKRLQETLSRARATLECAQKRYKLDYDKGVRVKNRNIRQGSFVYVKWGERPAGRSAKLDFPCHGPYELLENNGRTFKISANGVVETVSSDRITAAPGAPRHASANVRRNNVPRGGGESVSEDSQEWVVDKILAHGYDEDGRLLVEVKWKGYSPSWHYAETLRNDNLVSRYIRRAEGLYSNETDKPIGNASERTAESSDAAETTQSAQPRNLRRSARFLHKSACRL